MNLSDTCPCGAAVVMTSVTPDFVGWEAACEAGHRLLITDFESAPILIEDVETRLV